MTATAGARRPRLLVTASTYPRWRDDPEPAFVHELSRRLAARYDVTVLAPHAAGAARSETLDGVRVVRFRYAPARWEQLVQGGGIGTNLRRMPWLWCTVPLFLAAQTWSLARLLRSFRPDVVHAHWLIPQGASVRLLRALGMRTPPVLLTSHGADLFTFHGRMAMRLKRWIARGVDAATVVSTPMRPILASLGLDEARIEVAPMGVDLEDRFVPGTGTPEGDDILFVGRLVEKKGLAYLIRAMPAVLQERPAARLRIVGFGPEEDTCRMLVHDLGLQNHVEFMGAVSQADLPELYRRAGLLVAPFIESESGDQEGLGLVAVEATGCGCPVLVGIVRATADLVRLSDGGIHCVDARRTETLAASIVDILRDPERARTRASHACASIHARLSWSRVATRYGDLLDCLRLGRSELGRAVDPAAKAAADTHRTANRRNE